MSDRVSEGRPAPAGSGSPASDSTPSPPLRSPTTATATRSVAISIAASGDGLAIHDEKRLMSAEVLFDEGDLVDLAQRRQTVQDLLDGGFAEEPHPFLVRGLLHVRVGTPVEDHLTDAIRQVQQLADGGAPLEARPAAVDAAGAFVELMRLRERGIERRFHEQFRVDLRRALAV